MNWAELLGILLISTVRMCTPITLAAVGGVFSARSGVMALGLEGFMLMGAFGAAWGSFVSQNALVGLLCGVALSAFYSLIFALLCVVFSVNQVICGIGMNLFASGFTASMTQLVWGTRANSDIVPTLPHLTLPLVGDLSPLIPLMLVIVAASWFYLFRTPWGLRLRIVGENTPAAKSIGINAVRYKFLGVAISGVLCGLAGSFLSIDHVKRFVREMTAGRGFIAVAVNILGRFNPAGALGGGLLFGFTDSLSTVISSDSVPGQLLQMIPYAATLFVIVFAVKYVSAPAGMGKPVDE